MRNLIIFDLDGTLIDTRADLAYSTNLTRKDFGLDELPQQQIAGYVGNGLRKLIERSFPGSSPEEINRAIERFKVHYSENLVVKTEFYPGVPDGLKKLSAAGHYLAVLSNKPGFWVREIIDHFRLSSLFIALVGGGDSAAMKPEPDGIKDIVSTAEKAGFRNSSRNVFMVGDHHTDLLAAANAGITSIFCSYGYGSRSGEVYDIEAKSFKEVVASAGAELQA